MAILIALLAIYIIELNLKNKSQIVIIISIIAFLLMGILWEIIIYLRHRELIKAIQMIAK